MKSVISVLVITSIFFLCWSSVVRASKEEQGAERTTMERDKMIRFGLEAQERKKYLDAKEYFREALQTDPNSDLAWKYYDMAVLFALAEKVKKNGRLLAPVAMKTQTAESPAPPPAVKQVTTESTGAEGVEFTIVDDEDGCY